MKKTFYMLLCAAALLALTSACSPIRTVTPLPPQTSPSDAAVASIAPANGSTAPAPANAMPTNNPAAQTQPPAAVPVSLQVLSPQDGAIVNSSQIQVTGAASPGSVVTVNDDIQLVGADGQFQSTVSLDEGPNLIEVIASNSSGSESTVDVTVTYMP